jgi:putative ABC transport system permease protein
MRHDAAARCENRHQTIASRGQTLRGVLLSNRWIRSVSLESHYNPGVHMISRDSSRFDLLGAVRRELPHAARTLLRTPSFSLIAFITLALGIGATTAIYTVLDAVALRPMPYRSAERLVSVLHPATVPGNGESKWGMSAGGYFAFKNGNRSFDDLGGYTTSSTILLNAQGAEEARVAMITSSIFTTLQARAAIGRLAGEQDDVPGAPQVVVLSYEFWQRHFGGDRSVLGTILHAVDGPREIIGVAERGLSLPKPGPFASTADLAGFGVDLWVPLRLNPSGPFYNSHQYSGIARLKPGVTPDAAQRDLAAIMREFPKTIPNAYTEKFLTSSNFRVGVNPLRDEVLGPKLTRSLWVLFGAVGLVLCIACANLANLFLVRIQSRGRESAIRAALGADRAQMAVHFLSESLLLTLSAGIAGVLISKGGLGAILAIAPTDVPRLATVRLDGSSVLVAMALATIVGVVFGLLPLAQNDVDVKTLREGGRGLTSSAAQRAARSALVVSQVALALVLLAAAGLMLRSFANLRNVKPGLDPKGVLTFATILDGQVQSAEALPPLLQELQTRISGLPGVVSAGASSTLPLQDYGSGCTGVVREGLSPTGEKIGGCIATPSVVPGFFESLGIQMRGKPPVWTDYDPTLKSATVAVITGALANRMWPGEDPIGKGIAIGDQHNMNQYYRIVGVIPELRAKGLDQSASEAVFSAEPMNEPVWAVKTSSGDPMQLLPAIRRILNEIAPRAALVNPRAMSDVVARSMARATFIMTLLAIAGSMALLLSAVGIYGVISYIVTQRRSEIGVRVALGARLPNVASLVLGQTMRLTLAGVAIGVVASLAGMRVLGSLLFGVSPTDPAVLVGSSAMLLAIAIIASLAPTRRATQIDPVEAMRSA